MASRPLGVVIVDDEELARELVREFLAPHADVAVLATCANGFEAVKAVAEKKLGAASARKLRVRMSDMAAAGRVTHLKAQFQHLPRDPIPRFDRLIGIGVGPHGDRGDLVARFGQRLAQQPSRLGLGEQLRFEIQ
ncbi:MAG TPA: hypothetical protein PLB01_05030, partial [Thermoanaerobaculia bacterium]|nr:hypothetical protein [Thermoanaerobaculia bacterium]